MADQMPPSYRHRGVDETYIGGKASAVISRARTQQKAVIGMRERGGRVPPSTFRRQKDTIKSLLDRHIAVETKRNMTDEAIVYPFAMDKEFKKKHRTANHSTDWVNPQRYRSAYEHSGVIVLAAQARNHRLIPSREHKAPTSLLERV